MMRLQLPSATPTPDRLPDPDPILPPVSRSSPPRAEGNPPQSCHSSAPHLQKSAVPTCCLQCAGCGGGTLYGCTGRTLHGYMEGTLQEAFMVRLHCLSF